MYMMFSGRYWEPTSGLDNFIGCVSTPEEVNARLRISRDERFQCLDTEAGLGYACYLNDAGNITWTPVLDLKLPIKAEITGGDSLLLFYGNGVTELYDCSSLEFDRAHALRYGVSVYRESAKIQIGSTYLTFDEIKVLPRVRRGTFSWVKEDT